MRVKTLAVAAAAAITIAVFALQHNAGYNPAYDDTFSLDAVFYPGEQTLKITFEDKSGGVSNTTLQILGLSEPFLRQYDGYAFEENIAFGAEPQYGWKAHPVIVRFEHAEFGFVGIKTEAYPAGESAPKRVYESP